jgi:peptidoglycan/LPS O-acetylase OafA/YrhL
MTVQRFRGIDGLRAWLAWTVVAGHIGFLTGADLRSRFLVNVATAGTLAVLVFVIISGFVITHLLLTQNEPYSTYIGRRFLRIFPAYAICLGAGVLIMPLRMATVAASPFGGDAAQDQMLAAEIASLTAHGYGPHLAAHLTLLQGAIPDRWLSTSQYMFLGPAWSLSLEWQFYLIAPLVLRCLATQRARVLLMLGTAAAFAAFRIWGRGDFVSPSILPAAAPYFALGIGTRLLHERLPRLTTYPFVALILAGELTLLSLALLPCLVWLAFVAWMRLEKPADAGSALLDRVLTWMLDSRPARYLGERSYSTYLVHEPIIHGLVYLCFVRLALGATPTFPVVLALAPLLTLVAAAILFRWVESPGIGLGRRLLASAGRVPGRWYKPNTEQEQPPMPR